MMRRPSLRTAVMLGGAFPHGIANADVPIFTAIAHEAEDARDVTATRITVSPSPLVS
jgi:hypothetical protein